ncbi:MAG: hypothetical protein AAFX07_03710, partial [Pseudomonadota bacterium]
MLVDGPTRTLRCQSTKQHFEVVCTLSWFNKEFSVFYQSLTRPICVLFRCFADFFVRPAHERILL